MASSNPSTANTETMAKADNSSPLASSLADILSPDFNIHHVSHPPTRCDPLYSAPHGQKPPRTHLIRHFLAISSIHTSIIAYAIEIHVYRISKTSTTIFVSKADSTGFLPKPSSSAPKGSVSQIRAVTTAFLEHLIKLYSRPGIPTHLTLFARAQDQYLFPNSVHNKNKHVLSDIQLIRWWARALDPLVSSMSLPHQLSDSPKSYILVPGLDAIDLRHIIPSKTWIHGHPYSHPSKPVRECIPQFEDDPKARFLNELEEEGWKGCKTMKEFWELMAYRQECSLGKSVGFLSLIFETEKHPTAQKNDQSSQPVSSQASKKRKSPDPEAGDKTAKKRKVKLPEDIQSASTYTIASVLRNPKTQEYLAKRAIALRGRPSSFKSGNAADSNQGDKGRALSTKDYERLMNSLLDSDFQGLKCAKESSELWIKMAGKEELPKTAKKAEDIPLGQDGGEVKVNLLTVRKRKSEEELGGGVNVLVPKKKTKNEEPQVNVLLPRKKEPDAAPPVINTLQPRKRAKEPEPVVNILQPRKKPSTSNGGEEGKKDGNDVKVADGPSGRE